MTATPQIAVILPCYNPTPEELLWTLDSLRAQTVPFRLYLVDDGSAPKPDYEAALAGIDYRLILLEENRGVCTVRNPAIEQALANGFEYLAIIDCGDRCHPDRLAKQLAFFDNNPGIDVLGTASNSLDERHKLVYVFDAPLDHDAIVRHAFYGLPFRHPSMMFRARVFRDIGLYSNEFDAAEDYELVRRALGRFRMANLPDVLIDKVLAANSISTVRRRNQLRSRLRIQWRYRDLASLHCWLGLAKTVAVIVAPTALVKMLQPIVYGRGGSGTSRGTPPAPAASGKV